MLEAPSATRQQHKFPAPPPQTKPSLQVASSFHQLLHESPSGTHEGIYQPAADFWGCHPSITAIPGDSKTGFHYHVSATEGKRDLYLNHWRLLLDLLIRVNWCRFQDFYCQNKSNYIQEVSGSVFLSRLVSRFPHLITLMFCTCV